jgi:hypothetical protein
MLSANRTKIFFLLITSLLVSCDGTLGAFQPLQFPISKNKLEIAIDSLYSIHPEYKIPDKWKEENDWSKRGFNFLNSRIFYFKENPEEMYYTSIRVGNDSLTHIDIAIRSVFEDKKMKWLKQEDFSKEEETRIQERFKKEIISKLEKYTNSKSIDLDY